MTDNIVLDKDHVDALAALASDPFADISQWLSDRLWLAGLVSWDGPERRAVITYQGRALLPHGLKSVSGAEVSIGEENDGT